jgi:hypothetical protein
LRHENAHPLKKARTEQKGGSIVTEGAFGNIRELPVEEYLAECVQLNDLTLDEEMVRLPADYAYWNERYALAYRNYCTSKIEEERVRSERRLLLREEHRDDKGKTPTVDDLKSLVDTDGEVQTHAIDTINAEVEMKRLRGVLETLSIKRDMVQSIGARLRLEMQNDPMVRAQAMDRAAVRGGS